MKSSIESEEKFIERIFSQNGMLSQFLKDYEERQEQKLMAQQIVAAYRENKIALIEAGTGTGKSFAYLIPALIWALKHKEKTVISTHTIALQEQLLEKDIPFLLKVIQKDVKSCLVKGMRNYLCLRKLDELQEQPMLIPTEEQQELHSVERWSQKTKDGSKSDISFPLAHSVWDKISADGDSCNHGQCPHYKKCFFFKARREADEAQILIVNHALLFADIQSKRQEKESILPSYDRLVLDEAHHIEQIALDSSAQRLDRLHLLHSLLKLYADTHPEKTRLFLLRKDLLLFPKISPQIIESCETSLPAQIRGCIQVLDALFSDVRTFLDLYNDKKDGDDRKLRLKALHVESQNWQEHILPACVKLAAHLRELATSLFFLQKDLEPLKDTAKVSNHMLELQSISMRCQQDAEFLSTFPTGSCDPKRIRWIEMYRSNIALFEATLDVSSFCQEHLFSPLHSAVLCSATLTSARAFDYTKERLGLEKTSVTEGIYDSPFDFKERSLLLVPTDHPFPHEPTFLSQQIFTIERAIETSRGSVFVLFTSYENLLNCYKALFNGNIARKYPFMKQGDLPRHLLLEQFKKREGSVLFATDSFWEGVDVPGEALRCVILVKLPFPVPSDPLYEARAEALEKEGKDAFSHYAIPQAVIKFKQGFGRLLRSKKDRGCIICLDPRLVKKNYGKYFLNSLPPAATCFAPRDKMFLEMEKFFQRTSS